ncbi:MAG: hypothetical protein AAF915_01920 [Cyanobacteria bacterium P01_D01_bin.50]
MVAQFPEPAPTTSEIPRSVDYLHPEIKFHVYVNHVGDPYKTADISIQIHNVRVELAEVTFQRIQTYIAQTIASDMNPGVNVSDQTGFT